MDGKVEMANVSALDRSRNAPDRRQSARRRLFLDVTLRPPQAEECAGALHELSRTGFMLETGASLAVGSSFTIVGTGDTPRTACVVWSASPYYACEFEQPLSEGDLSAVMLRSLPPKPDWKMPGVVRQEVYDRLREAGRPRAARLRALAIGAGMSWVIAVVCLVATLG